MNCQRCDKPLSGRQRKWCSENCCKRACADEKRRACIDCGRSLGEGSAWTRARRCHTCDNTYRAARLDERIQMVAGLYNGGATYREIIDALGWSTNSTPGPLLQIARDRGLISFRYAACEQRAA